MTRQVGSRYRLGDELGRGGFGTVHRADGPDGPVAIKILRPELTEDPDVISRFVRERAVLLKLRHPGLVQVRDLVVEGDLLALVMDLVEGPTLRSHLDAGGPLPPAQAGALVADLADALAAVHSHGVVHRDLKPANVLLSSTESGLVPLLTDFGVARLVEGTVLTTAQAVIGTPGYLAPELVRGQPASPAADVYACGVLLYELVTGEPPLRADHPLAVLMRHANEQVERPDAMPPELWSITARCLDKDPQARPTAQQLHAALSGVGEGAPTAVLNRRPATRVLPPATGVHPTPRRKRFGNLALASTFVVGLCLGAVAGAVRPAPAPQAASGPQPAALAQMPVTQVTNGLGPVALNSAVGAENVDDGGKITIGGQTYEHGFGTHAPSQLRAYPGGACTRFDAVVGVDSEAQGGGSVTFQVHADGQIVFDSGLITAAKPGAPVGLDISGAQVLDLVVTDGGDGADLDHADWAEPTLTCG